MLDLEAHGLLPSRRPKRPDDGSRTIATVLDRWVAQRPSAEALVGRSGRFSFAELDRQVRRAAAVLAGFGVRPADRVAACLPNDVDIVIAFLATAKLGAIWVGVNRPLAAPEKQYLLEDSGASIFIATPEVLGEVETLSDASLPTLVSVDEFRARVARAGDAFVASAVIDSFAPAAIAYTSGTTGFPKGAVHSHHNLLLPGAVVAHSAVPEARLRQGVVLPLTILNLMVLAPLVAYQTGNCCVAMDRIDAEGIAWWVRTEKIASFASVPTIMHDLLTHPNVKAEDLASMIRPEVGGADVPESLRELIRERYDCEVTIGYGMTEAPTSVTRAQSANPEPGLCGTPLPQIEITVRDEANEPVPVGTIGEICVGPSKQGTWAGVYTTMLGYWNEPEATREALEGGVYRTGDLGFIDDQGVLFIRGRKKELILRGGANVYPAEVERVLHEHPKVRVAAVLGVPDERLGQIVVAAIEVEGDAGDESALASELAFHCAKSLARYKVPARFRVVDAMPRNAMNKIVKPRLAGLFG